MAKEKVETAEREIPAIMPRAQRNYWNSQNFAWREAFIGLPNGLVSQDLTDYPQEVWKRIQQDNNLALRRFDKVFCVSHDGTWAVEARVGFADGTRVVLSGVKVLTLPDPKDAGMYDDGTYRVAPHPGGYVVESVRSGASVDGSVYASPVAAKSALLSRYPKRAVA